MKLFDKRRSNTEEKGKKSNNCFFLNLVCNGGVAKTCHNYQLGRIDSNNGMQRRANYKTVGSKNNK